jgi:hypothetical protein
VKSNRFLFLLIFIILLAILLTSCDGGFSVNGKVYEWVDAPSGAKGEMYFDVDAPTSRITNPISGVDVYFFQIPTTTDIAGAFHESTMVAPGQYMMDIRVEKEGYFTLTGEFQHEGGSKLSYHDIVIFMVRDK